MRRIKEFKDVAPPRDAVTHYSYYVPKPDGYFSLSDGLGGVFMGKSTHRVVVLLEGRSPGYTEVMPSCTGTGYIGYIDDSGYVIDQVDCASLETYVASGDMYDYFSKRIANWMIVPERDPTRLPHTLILGFFSISNVRNRPPSYWFENRDAVIVYPSTEVTKIVKDGHFDVEGEEFVFGPYRDYTVPSGMTREGWVCMPLVQFAKSLQFITGTQGNERPYIMSYHPWSYMMHVHFHVSKFPRLTIQEVFSTSTYTIRAFSASLRTYWGMADDTMRKVRVVVAAVSVMSSLCVKHGLRCELPVYDPYKPTLTFKLSGTRKDGSTVRTSVTVDVSGHLINSMLQCLMGITNLNLYVEHLLSNIRGVNAQIPAEHDHGAPYWHSWLDYMVGTAAFVNYAHRMGRAQQGREMVRYVRRRLSGLPEAYMRWSVFGS
jgi:hypothetical protein